MRVRPAFLAQRTIQGRRFSENVTLVRTSGFRNEDQDWRGSGQTANIRCATAPMPGEDDMARLLEDGGVRLEDTRLFWTREELVPASLFSAGDILVFEGERFRVAATDRWGQVSESVGIRQDPDLGGDAGKDRKGTPVVHAVLA